MRQIAAFGVVGIVCFLIDYATMILLTEFAGMNYLLSCGISFSVSLVANYLLSMRFVFKSKHDGGKAKEFILFVILGISNLLLTEVFMWVGVEWLSLHYMFVKVAVTGIVMVCNFVTKKIVLEGWQNHYDETDPNTSYQGV